jgi:hypothetical protein
MSTEFNFKRAWDEVVKPVFQNLPAEVHKALNATRAEVDSIKQVGASKTVSGYSTDLMGMFDAIPTSILAWAAEVVYYYGHLAYGKQCLDGGLYWKFQDLASMSMIARKPYDGELIHQAEVKMKNLLEGFDDHEEGTEYGDDELPAYLLSISPKLGKGIVKIYKVDHVNHKPDVFCIGPRHFPKDGGMFIKPEQAPCCNCGQDYSAHTSDRVMFLQPIVDHGQDPDTFLKSKHIAIQGVLEHILELTKAASIKLDGFAFVKP